MRVIFLDFDGVLHPLGLQVEGTRLINGKPVVRPIKVDFFCWVTVLDELLREHPDVRLVVHSAWRESHTEDALGAYLGPLQPRYLGATSSSLDKYASILQWLEGRTDIVGYRILDDAELEFPSDPGVEEYIACHYQRGIADPAVHEALRIWLSNTAPAA